METMCGECGIFYECDETGNDITGREHVCRKSKDVFDREEDARLPELNFNE